FYNSPGFCDEYTHLFLATELEPRTRAAVSHEEAAMTIERVPLAGVDDLIAGGELVDAKSIIGLLLARRFLAGQEAGRGRAGGRPARPAPHRARHVAARRTRARAQLARGLPARPGPVRGVPATPRRRRRRRRGRRGPRGRLRR